MQDSDSKNIQIWDRVISSALQIPGVKVSREQFLRRELDKYCDEDVVLKAIENSPTEAGISPKIIKKISKSIISGHRMRTTSLSAAAGFPGGWWAAGTIPTDISQFFWNVTVISQKLAYLHGWPDFNDSGIDGTDERTKELLTLFIGVMFGVNAANAGITRLSAQVASEAAKRIPRHSLTKTVWYPIFKKVAQSLGYKITKDRTGQIVSKAVPVLGSLISGGITWFSFGTMATRLQNHLEGLYLHTRKPQDLEEEQSLFEDVVEDFTEDSSDDTKINPNSKPSSNT